MEIFILYGMKMILCSAMMLAYYLLFLRDKTFHHYNRFYLLITVVSSLLLPLLKVEYFSIETDNSLLLLLNAWQDAPADPQPAAFNLLSVLVFCIGGVSLGLLGRMMAGLLQLQRLKKQFPKSNVEGITFYNTNLEDAPFSFFKNLFWKKTILLHSDLGQQILKHEMVHIEQKHSIDKLLIQSIQSLFWFNPVFYFIKKEINLVHEYLADKKSVKQNDTKAFAEMLLASSFSGNSLPATSPFISSNLKKRLLMITQKNTPYSYARRILALPILFIVSFVLLVNAKNREIKKYNREMAVAVLQLKKDTLKPQEVQQLIQAHQEKMKKASEKLKNDAEKIRLLSDESSKKTEELQKIAKEKGEDSYEFEWKAKELNQLGKEIDKLAAAQEKKAKEKVFEFHLDEIDTFFDAEVFKNKFPFDEEKLKKLEQKLNSAALKNGMAKIKILRLQEGAPEPPVLIENESWKEKTNLSKEDQKKLEKLAQERAELAKKQAELAKKQAELARKQAEISGLQEKGVSLEVEVGSGAEKSIVRKTAPRVFMFKKKDDHGMDNAKIYIDGKLSTHDEMKQIKPEDIVSVHVNKNNNNGKEEGEIRIQTK